MASLETREGATREGVMLERLRESYERQGYEFFVHPSGDLLPTFLQGYRPDAIALKSGDRIIIEVKVGNQPSWGERLSELAARVKGQPGWHIKVHSAQPRAEDSLDLQTQARDIIRSRLQEIEELALTGQSRAAFVMGWSVLEAVVRDIASERGIDAGRPFSSGGLVQFLEMQGMVDAGAGQLLRQQAHLRNLVVHGDLSTEVSPGAVTALISLIGDLLAQGGSDQLKTGETRVAH